MPDTKIRNLNDGLTAEGDDRLPATRDPTGTPTDVFITPDYIAARARASIAGGIVANLSGGGAVIPTGIRGYIRAPYAMTLTKVTALADQTGSIVVDIWKDSYANFPPANADSITASAPVTISAGMKSEDATLTGWTTSIAVGDVLGFNVDSCSAITQCAIILEGTRS